MNFFEYQEQARKNTRWLIFLFILAVISLIALTDILVVFFYYALSSEYNSDATPLPFDFHIYIAITISVIVLLASLYRMTEMDGGGPRVAEELGGRLIPSSTKDPKERQLLNVVEEMAIASGIPVPQVYVLEDITINAFAAGFDTHDAVIGVTRGTIDLLNRDELQGVIAHEFSHIFNGDMRLNIRLISILYGILFIGLIGEKIVNYSGHSKDGAKAMIFGVGLIVIGYSGLFFGNMIKATVSRQREFLADASSVQFTRNPDGIGGALKKIGGWTLGSRLGAINAAEYSHCYIAEGVSMLATGFFRTHPKLEDRIRRIEPRWDGRYPEVKRVVKKSDKEKETSKPFKTTFFKEPENLITMAVMVEAISATGAPTSEHVEYAKKLIADIPEKLLLASREPLTAYALILGLFMDKGLLKNIPEQDRLLKGIDREVCKQLRLLVSQLLTLDIKYRLPLIELAIPSLKSLSKNQLEQFEQHMLLIINHDKRVEFWEWALHWIITQSLNKPDIAKARYDNFNLIENETAILLSATVYTANSSDELGQQAYITATTELGISIEKIEKNKINSTELLRSIAKVRELKPLIKPRFLKALSLAAEHDGVIEPEEIEFIRAIAEGIDCPMPPLLDKAE
jgi:Zn-dependent protease with chaperone function